MRIIAYVLVLVMLSSINAFALRTAPIPVQPVEKDGVEYRANHDQMGIVEAWDIETKHKLWSVQVYQVEIRKWIEDDLQWIFITKLTLDGDHLVVENENGHVYRVDLSTRAISSSDSSFLEARPLLVGLQGKMDLTVQLLFLSFSKDVIDKLLPDGLTATSLLNEWEHGRGSLISAPIITTPSGQEASMKSVRECIYPTVLSWTDRGASVTSASNSVQFVVPTDFQTREVGLLISVLPEYIATDNAIDLMLSFEYLPEPEWRTFSGATSAPQSPDPPRIEQPIFRPLSINMSAQIPNSEPALLAGGVDISDGKSLVYIIATATAKPEK